MYGNLATLLPIRHLVNMGGFKGNLLLTCLHFLKKTLEPHVNEPGVMIVVASMHVARFSSVNVFSKQFL